MQYFSHEGFWKDLIREVHQAIYQLFFFNDCKLFGILYTKVILEKIFTKYIAYEIIWQKCSSILQMYLLQVHLLLKHSTSIFISNLAYKLFPNTVMLRLRHQHANLGGTRFSHMSKHMTGMFGQFTW